MITAYLIIGLILFMVSIGLFDDFIEYQYKHYREQWKKDGSPRGYGFKPFGSSYLSFYLISFKGFKKLPFWAAEDKVAIKKLNRLTNFHKVYKWYLILLLPVIIIATNT